MHCKQPNIGVKELLKSFCLDHFFEIINRCNFCKHDDYQGSGLDTIEFIRSNLA